MANLILILGDQVSQWHKALGLNVEIRPDTITTEVIELVNEHFSEHFGTTDDFHYAVTTEQARQALGHFIDFALLAGVKPEATCDWYLAVYIDAFDWVELPNTLGMVMHADGGYLGSKPYAASGKYIQRMSDHCQTCHYRVQDATGDRACPFNSLYWHFIDRHRQDFANNPRMTMMYRNWDKQAPERRQAILTQADELLQDIENL